jgi:ribonucleotide reductase beta subunit family protein with ferritin-like domain/putative sterol carrier protein
MKELPTKSPLDRISYEDLYRRWEKGNWSAMEINFSEDKEQWHNTFSEIERKAALWNYSLFFHGEDSVTDNLSPYIDAAPKEEQKYFLATQQVDEARHAVFFKRFMHEVVGAGTGDIASALEATRPELTWGFRKTFAKLDQVADELRRDHSRPKFAQAITMYHLVVEAALAQPGQHFIESYLTERGLLPGFAGGMKNVSLDEQRHIGFGVKVLSELIAEDPECKDAIADLLSEVMVFTIGVLQPPNWDRRYTECFGFTLEDIYAEGFASFETKMRTAGLPLEEIQYALPIPLELDQKARAERAIKLLEAGYAGEKNGPPARDHESMELLFDSIQRSARTDLAPDAMTIQWDFSDAEPWYLRIDNGSTSTESGRAPSPDVTLSCRFDDWVDVIAAREDPRKQMLKRKIRPKGGLRALYRMSKVFPR